jgi:hypothetical chaperone protein
MPAFVGIDFGTSNTTIGVSSPEQARLLPLEGDHQTLPSAIFFDFASKGSFCGRAAREHYLEGHEGRYMQSLKSILGSSLIDEKTRIQSKSMSFADILGVFFAFLKKKMEVQLGHDVSQIVVGRPVHFVDGDEAADRQAQRSLEDIARKQGFREVAFQYEPIAAALDYEQQVQREELVLIVDIGGGTSDFSIVRVSPQRAGLAQRKGDILANGGVHIGGTDFDRSLSLARLMPHLGLGSKTADGKRNLPVHYFYDLATWHSINFLYRKGVATELRAMRYEAARRDLVDRLIRVVDDRHGHTLALAIEQAKIALTSQATANIDVPYKDWETIAATRAAFDEAVGEAVGRVVKTVEALLKDASLKAGDIDTIFVTGGSSMVPILRHGILSLFPAAKVETGNLLGSVGLGLALDARRKYG